jgi:hypothetical protein
MNEATDLASWFTDDELEPCPACGELKLIPAPEGRALRVCLDCGVVDVTLEPAAA